ncbi:hypothetical protein ACFWCB_15850 [Streptomyces sp. NPDC060048]|uniref:hypothetical protein n=1 Tax=unclassified Streptomyces TaxID=2593676 RepID=UPI0036C84094
MGMLMTCLVSLAGVNIVLGLTRLWRRSVEARMVRQVRAWPGFDAYHAGLLSAAEPLCSTDHQPDRLTRNSARAADVAVRLMREDGLLHGRGLEVVEDAAEPAHPVTGAAYRALGRYPSLIGRLRRGDISSDPGFQTAVRAHLNELFTHAPATRHHMGSLSRDLALWSYAIGAAAPALHAFLLMRGTAPDDPDVAKGSFVLASLIFVAALIVIAAQAGNTWHPLADLEVPAALKEPAPPGEDPVDSGDGAGEPPRDDVRAAPRGDVRATPRDDAGETPGDDVDATFADD